MKSAKYQDVKKDLLAGAKSPLYFLYGAEPYFVDDLAETAERSILNPGEEAFNKSVFYGRDSQASQIVDQVRRFPMMAERQLVIVKEAQLLADFDKLKPIFEKPVKSTVCVIVFKKPNVDGRKAIFKMIGKNAVVFESKTLYENQVRPWLSSFIKDKKLKVSPLALDLLVEYLGTDLEQLVNAVNKLAISGKEGEITDKMVRDTIGISRNYSVFELQDALGQRIPEQILKITEMMEQDVKNHPPQMIIPSLFSYISKLYSIKHLGNNLEMVKKAINIHSNFIVKKYMNAAKKYERWELENMIHALRDYDLKTKGVDTRDIGPQELLRELMLRLVDVRQIH